jgi:AraC-like DNA-binding protein
MIETAPTLIISSAPLHWPNVMIERHATSQLGSFEDADPNHCHRIVIFEELIACTVKIGSEQSALPRGSPWQVVVPTGVSVKVMSQQKLQFTSIGLKADYIAKMSKDIIGHVTKIRSGIAALDPVFPMLGQLLAMAATAYEPLDPEMIAVIARECATRLLHNFGSDSFERHDLSGKLPGASLVRVLNLIARKLGDPVSVEDMAREAGLSRSHFARSFASTVGRAPHAYLMARRVAKAEQLLRGSALSINQIAAVCGFHDQAHLTRNFRQRFGQTPHQYRFER